MQQLKEIDSTIPLYFTGYNFFKEKFDKYQTDVLECRLLTEKFICMRGEAAAKLFYDQEKFSRKKAAPKRLKKTLFGKKGVQGLDGKKHMHRKAMFMQFMNPENLEQITTLFEQHWKQYVLKWENEEKINLFEQTEEVIFKAVCEWMGVPFEPGKVTERTRHIAAMIDGAGGVALRYFQGKKGRKDSEEWIMGLIEMVKSGKLKPASDSIFIQMINFKDINGKTLDDKVLAVEILNLIRPTVAIARYIVFSAHALHLNPHYQQILKKGNDEMVHWFVQEVRRYYPFFPFVVARTREDFDWNGYHFPAKRKVLLDLYGTNHDSNIWLEPEKFYPERFKEWDGGAFNFIPQGGGDHQNNHRCAGEWLTIKITESALKLLTRKMTYNVPEQDLTLEMTHMPSLPKSRMIINQVKAI